MAHARSPRRPAPAQRPSRPSPLFRRSGLTSEDLASYWRAVAERALPHLARRPLTLVRCAGGVSEAPGTRPEGQGCGYLRHVPMHLPASVERARVPTRTKGERLYPWVEGVEGLANLARWRVVELHTVNWTVDAPGIPDRFVLDLDPGIGVGWPEVVAAARAVRELLGRLGLDSWCKTTGGRGLHVVAPLVPQRPADEVLAFTRDVARVLSAAQPDRFTHVLAKAERGGRILIDYLRNKRLDTAVAAFSPRARAGAPVGIPVAWDGLEAVQPAAFDVRTVPRRAGADPWRAYWSRRQRLEDTAVQAVAALAMRAGYS